MLSLSPCAEIYIIQTVVSNIEASLDMAVNMDTVVNGN